MNKELWTKIKIGALYALIAIVSAVILVFFVRALIEGHIVSFARKTIEQVPATEEIGALVPEREFHDWHKLAADRESLTGLDILGMWESEPNMIVIVYIPPSLLDGNSSPATLVEFIAQSVIYWSGGHVRNILVWIVSPGDDDCITIKIECGYRMDEDGSPELWRVADRSDECLDPRLVIWPGVGQ